MCRLTLRDAGAPCDNFKGYCDVFQKCRAVNEDGPLARLKNLLFNKETFNDVRDWITVIHCFSLTESEKFKTLLQTGLV